MILRSFDEIAKIHQLTNGKKLALVGGTFDLLHPGHVAYLRAAKSVADVLIVHVDSDEHVQKNKGRDRPIMSCDMRMTVVDALATVDYVITSPGVYYHPFITDIVKPDVLVRSRRPNSKIAEEINGILVVYIAETSSIHTTDLVHALDRQSENLVDLMNLAKTASKRGLSYSGMQVGAAVCTQDGRVYMGCNISNASPALAMCAERMAIHAAILDGATKISSVAVYTADADDISPCGLCRQVIAEAALPQARIFTQGAENTRTFTVEQALPWAFRTTRRSNQNTM